MVTSPVTSDMSYYRPAKMAAVTSLGAAALLVLFCPCTHLLACDNHMALYCGLLVFATLMIWGDWFVPQ